MLNKCCLDEFWDFAKISEYKAESYTRVQAYIGAIRSALPDKKHSGHYTALNMYITALSTANVSYVENMTDPRVLQQIFSVTLARYLNIT